MSIQLDLGLGGLVRDFLRTLEVRFRNDANLTIQLFGEDPALGAIFGDIKFDPGTATLVLTYRTDAVVRRFEAMPERPRRTRVDVEYLPLSEAMGVLWHSEGELARAFCREPQLGPYVLGLRWSPSIETATVLLNRELIERAARDLAKPVEVRFELPAAAPPEP